MFLAVIEEPRVYVASAARVCALAKVLTAQYVLRASNCRGGVYIYIYIRDDDEIDKREFYTDEIYDRCRRKRKV